MRVARYPTTPTNGMQCGGSYMELDTHSNCRAAPNGHSTYPYRMDHPTLFLLLPAPPASGSDSMDNSTSGMVPHAITTTFDTSRLHVASAMEFLPKTGPTAKSGDLSRRPLDCDPPTRTVGHEDNN